MPVSLSGCLLQPVTDDNEAKGEKDAAKNTELRAAYSDRSTRISRLYTVHKLFIYTVQ